MTGGQIWQNEWASDLAEVVNAPALKRVGNYQKQMDIAAMMVDSIYLAFGRDMERSRMEREQCVRRFVETFSTYTIADMQHFDKMLVAGKISFGDNQPINVVNLFKGWRDYIFQRNEAITYAEMRANRVEYAPNETPLVNMKLHSAPDEFQDFAKLWGKETERQYYLLVAGQPNDYYQRVKRGAYYDFINQDKDIF